MTPAWLVSIILAFLGCCSVHTLLTHRLRQIDHQRRQGTDHGALKFKLAKAWAVIIALALWWMGGSYMYLAAVHCGWVGVR